MSSTLQLNESTLTVDANENEIALSWTPEKLTFPGIKFDEIPISILLRYKVNPMGINTTTPVIK